MRTPARIALGLFVLVFSLIAPAALGDDDVTATKSVSGSFIQGTNVTYTIVMTNNMAVTQNDNPGDEFRDPMPSGLLFVSASASSGTAVYLTTIDTVGWNGSIPAGGSVTLTIVATINPAASGLISNQGQTFYDADANGSNESSSVTDDPSTGTADDATSFAILQSGIVSATKSVSGTFVQGTDVTYTVVITNDMTITQGDNDGHEFSDSLPDNTTFVSASATSGTISTGDNSVLWDGSLAAGESVTITIVAAISPIVTGEISNQGSTVFDRDGDGQNDSNQPTDDPSTEAAYDATTFYAVPASSFEFSAANYDVSESAASFDVTVNRTGGSAGVAEVSYTIAAGTAQGEDFAGGTFGLSFADGETSKTFNVTIVDDAIDELDQTIALSLSDPSDGSTLGAQNTATITIQDDDAPPTLSIDDVTLTEGDSGSQVATFTITKTGETELDVSITADPTLVSGTATCCGPSNDWSGPITGETFFPGTTTRTVQVTVFGDLTYENDETVIMTLTDAVNATIADDTGVLTILNNDSPSADLSITKTDTPDPIVAGSALTYTVTVANAGPNDAADVTMSDTVPAGTTFLVIQSGIPSGWSCNTPGVGGTGTISCTNPSFASGGSAVFSILLAVNSGLADGTVITNTATVSTSTYDPNGSNDSATTTTTVQPLSATGFTHTKTVTGDFHPGGTVTITATMTNNMGHDQQNNFGNEWADILPSQLTLVSASAPSGTLNQSISGGFVTWNGLIPDGTSMTITVVCTIKTTASGTVSNQAFSSIDTDNNGTNETSSPSDDPSTAAEHDATVFTIVPAADLSITKTDTPDPIVAGSALTYTVTVTNAGPNAAADVTMSDTVPAGTTFLVIQSGIPSGWSCNTPGVGGTGTISCTNPSFASGGSAVFSILLAVNSGLADGTVITNTATVSTSTYDPNSGNDSATTTTTVQPLSATGFTHTKTITGDFRAGGTITITATMTNNMGHDQQNNFGNEWADILPSQLTLVSASAPSGTLNQSIFGGFVTWNGSIPDGTSMTITVVCTIKAGVSGTVSNQAFSSIDTDGNGTNETSSPSDDPSTAAANDATAITVGPSGTVTGTKSVSGSFVQGTNVTYTIVLTNNMLVTQPNNFQHEFTDLIPAGLTYVSSTASSGTTGFCCSNTFFWDGSIPAGGTVTITITAAIGATASGTISNQGNVIYDNDGGNSNESSTLTDDPSTAAANDTTSFNVVQSGIVTSTMSVSGTFVQGTNVTYTVVMTNNMTVIQPDNFGHEWTDILPSGLTPVSVSASSGTIAICCGNSIVFWDGSIASGASVTLTIVATISSTATGTISNQGQTIFDRNSDGQNESSQVTDDPSTAASYDATSFTVIANQADLSLTMTYAPSVPGPSDNITYTLLVSNAGPLTATNVVVSDDRPDSAAFQSVSTTAGSCTTADPVVCSVGSLASGASATITLVVKAPSSYDPLTNSATATSDLPDPTPASASTSITCMKSNGKPCKK